MHNLAKKIAECLKAKVEGIGIDNIQGEDLKEFGEWVDIIKDIACYDKDMRIIKAMDEAEDGGEAMKYIEMYEDYPEMRKGYRGQPRDSRGRYMSRGRRGYEDWDSMQYMRDIDRDSMERMYYSGSMGGGGSNGSSGMSGGMSGGNSGSGQRGYSESERDSREGRSGSARRGYMETKELHKMNTPEAKQHKMKELEHYMSELSGDITEMISDASPEEKNLLKAKLQTLTTKIQ